MNISTQVLEQFLFRLGRYSLWRKKENLFTVQTIIERLSHKETLRMGRINKRLSPDKGRQNRYRLARVLKWPI